MGVLKTMSSFLKTYSQLKIILCYAKPSRNLHEVIISLTGETFFSSPFSSNFAVVKKLLLTKSLFQIKSHDANALIFVNTFYTIAKTRLFDTFSITHAPYAGWILFQKKPLRFQCLSYLSMMFL